MQLFLFEHVCGGGMVADHLPGSLLVQGRAMLQAVLHDFAAMGVDVTVTLDHRLDTLDLSPARVLKVDSPAALSRRFDELAQAADLVMVIAPESGSTLANWLRRLEQLGVKTLNGTSDSVLACSDKLKLALRLTAAGVPTPPTQRLGSAAALTWPSVVKPRFGAGCERTHLCRGPDDLAHLPHRTDWIVQPRVRGVAASCSLILRDGRVHVLPGGYQIIHFGWAMQYVGGRLPLGAERQHRAAALAQQAVATVPGLSGYIGVDLVLGGEPADDRVIEINPRITMSYLGLRQILPVNLAAIMLGKADLPSPACFVSPPTSQASPSPLNPPAPPKTATPANPPVPPSAASSPSPVVGARFTAAGQVRLEPDQPEGSL